MKALFISAFVAYFFALCMTVSNAEPSNCPNREEYLLRFQALQIMGKTSETLMFKESKTHYAEMLGQINPAKDFAADEVIVGILKSGGFLMAFGVENKFCVIEGVTDSEDLLVGREMRKRRQLEQSQHDI